jgi:hypothetical protein
MEKNDNSIVKMQFPLFFVVAWRLCLLKIEIMPLGNGDYAS